MGRSLNCELPRQHFGQSVSRLCYRLLSASVPAYPTGQIGTLASLLLDIPGYHQWFLRRFFSRLCNNSILKTPLSLHSLVMTKSLRIDRIAKFQARRVQCIGRSLLNNFAIRGELPCWGLPERHTAWLVLLLGVNPCLLMTVIKLRFVNLLEPNFGGLVHVNSSLCRESAQRNRS